MNYTMDERRKYYLMISNNFGGMKGSFYTALAIIACGQILGSSVNDWKSAVKMHKKKYIMSFPTYEHVFPQMKNASIIV